MRLFVAINFGGDTRGALLALRDALRDSAKSGRFSLPENLHLTLAFLGACDARQTAAARAAMDTLHFAPLSVRVERVGRFRREGGDTWWAGVHESKPLLDLQRALADALTAAGFRLEARRYSPHITLGREVVTDAVAPRIEPFGETVAQIDLMKSERIGGRLVYTAIHTKPADV
jgi:2'-5' RNA ligase